MVIYSSTYAKFLAFYSIVKNWSYKILLLVHLKVTKTYIQTQYREIVSSWSVWYDSEIY